MKKLFVVLLGLSVVLSGKLVAQAQVEIRTSQLTPDRVKKWLDQYGIDQRFTVIDDDLIKDEDEGAIEDDVTALHLVARTSRNNGQNGKKMYELAQNIVRERPQFVNARQSGGFTPLHNAAYRGYKNMVRLFLDSVENPAQSAALVDKKYKKNAEEWAIAGGRIQTARMLQQVPTPEPTVHPFSPRTRIRRVPGMPPPYVGAWK